MRVRTFLSAGLVSLVLLSAAVAADPIMPLSEVQIGMQCTGYSVFKGTAVESFDVEIVDVVGQAAIGATPPALLVKVSGERIDADRRRARVLGLARLLPGCGRRLQERRRDLRDDRRLRRQDRAGDADRSDHRHADRGAAGDFDLAARGLP